MHPIERLRHVARARGAGPSLLGREAAGALAGFASDPPGLVTACRRLVDRHPTDGPVWWLAARVLAAADPSSEAWRAADLLDDDPIPGELAAMLPGEATVVIVGWPELTAQALRRRADLIVLAADGGSGDGDALVARLLRDDGEAVAVPDAGVAAAVAEADLVIVEATAMGAETAVVDMGSAAAAAAAWVAQVPVWLVAGKGRALPEPMWKSLTKRLANDGVEPWDRERELLPLQLVAQIVGESEPDCPVAAELLRPIA
jgi:hypothetical protein